MKDGVDHQHNHQLTLASWLAGEFVVAVVVVVVVEVVVVGAGNPLFLSHDPLVEEDEMDAVVA